MQAILFNKNKSFYSKKNLLKFADKFVFTPHPFLNWSLNPFYKNKDGELVHMLERHHIEGRAAEMISQNLKGAYNEHC